VGRLSPGHHHLHRALSPPARTPRGFEADARTDLRRLLDGLHGAGRTVIELVRGRGPTEPWRLYPGEEGIFDRRTGCQFYYHSHGSPGEDGHFHTVRLFPDRTVHLVAISMAEDGWPRALFTVNRWVVGDSYEPPEVLRRHVEAFAIGPRRGPAGLVAFINLAFRAFRPEILRLQEEREARLAAYRAEHPGVEPLEDRSLEVLSRVAVDLRQAPPAS